MLTVVLAVLCLLLAISAAVFALLWRAGSLHVADQARLIRHQCERINGYRAELDALSIAGPAVDTVNGSHDRYPQMTDNTRDIVTAYCERMWHHTQEQP